MKRMVGIFSLTVICAMILFVPGTAAAQYPGVPAGGFSCSVVTPYTTGALIAGLQTYLADLSWRGAMLSHGLDVILFMVNRGHTRPALRLLDVFLRTVSRLKRFGIFSQSEYDSIYQRVVEIRMTIEYGGGILT